MNKQDDAYIARCSCGGIIFAGIILKDVPSTKKDIGREVGKLIKQGHEVGRMACNAVRKARWCRGNGECKDNEKKESKSSTESKKED